MRVSSCASETVAMRGLSSQEILSLWTGDHKLGVMARLPSLNVKASLGKENCSLHRNSTQHPLQGLVAQDVLIMMTHETLSLHVTCPLNPPHHPQPTHRETSPFHQKQLHRDPSALNPLYISYLQFANTKLIILDVIVKER